MRRQDMVPSSVAVNTVLVYATAQGTIPKTERAPMTAEDVLPS